MNAEWHRAHPMPRNATQEQRVVWHLEHADACTCREMPENLRAAVEALRRARAAGAAPPESSGG